MEKKVVRQRKENLINKLLEENRIISVLERGFRRVIDDVSEALTILNKPAYEKEAFFRDVSKSATSFMNSVVGRLERIQQVFVGEENYNCNIMCSINQHLTSLGLNGILNKIISENRRVVCKELKDFKDFYDSIQELSNYVDKIPALRQDIQAEIAALQRSGKVQSDDAPPNSSIILHHGSPGL